MENANWHRFLRDLIHVVTSSNWDAVVMSAITAVVTIWYVVLTSKLVRDARRSSVGVRVLPDRDSFNAMFLEVMNFSNNIASGVVIEADPDPLLSTGKRLTQVIGDIPVLFPNETVRAYLFNAANSKQIMSMFPHSTIKIKARWHDGSAKRPSLFQTQISVSQYIGLPVLGSDERIASALERTTGCITADQGL